MHDWDSFRSNRVRVVGNLHPIDRDCSQWPHRLHGHIHSIVYFLPWNISLTLLSLIIARSPLLLYTKQSESTAATQLCRIVMNCIWKFGRTRNPKFEKCPKLWNILDLKPSMKHRCVVWLGVFLDVCGGVAWYYGSRDPGFTDGIIKFVVSTFS